MNVLNKNELIFERCLLIRNKNINDCIVEDYFVLTDESTISLASGEKKNDKY